MSVAGVEQRATALLGIHWQEVPDDGHLPVRRSLSQNLSGSCSGSCSGLFNLTWPVSSR